MKAKIKIPNDITIKNDVIIDKPLNRSTKYNEAKSSELNCNYYFNLKSGIRSLFSNTPYRFGVSGNSALNIIFKTIYNFIKILFVPIITLLIFIAIVSKTISLPLIILLLFLSLIVSIGVHEGLHLYFFRRFTKHKEFGTLILKNTQIFAIFPSDVKITHIHQFCIAAIPPLLVSLVGILAVMTFVMLELFLLYKILFITLSLPWCLHVFSLFPFSSDAKLMYLSFLGVLNDKKKKH